jgi:ribosomal protein S18 acetylase RimI-like enzyme
MEIRLLQSGDEGLAEQACRLYTPSAVNPGAFLNAPNTTMLIAADDNRVVGFAYGHELVHPDGERTMSLYSLGVAESHRRQGVGRQLVELFIEDARERNCTEVWVLTSDDNAAGSATYTSAGGAREPIGQMMYTWRLAAGRHSGDRPTR